MLEMARKTGKGKPWKFGVKKHREAEKIAVGMPGSLEKRRWCI